MNNVSMETKRRYQAKARRSNYQASMELEGITVDYQARKANKAEVLAKYGKHKAR
ncbi:YhfG family protein [Vreelandella sp. EE27]